MDSITQMVLGAAVGELALGKKIGNRALIWGGIGGTIPDLDIIANSFLSPIDALVFHRGITHSIIFSVLAPFVFGWVVHQLYDKKVHKTWPYKIFLTVILVAILFLLSWGINYIFRDDGEYRWWLLISTALLALYLLWRLYKFYLRKDLEEPQAEFRDWYLLFFLAFATHWLLDCFTAYGTQIFTPFSDYRVAFNNISIVDPIYTVPFLICIVIAAFFKRDTRKRRLFTWMGLGFSTLYMAFTIVNKWRVDQVFESALSHRQLDVSRCRCSPTILNNILWSCVAEGENDFYVGQYSLFDTDPNFHYLNAIHKNDSIHQKLLHYEDYQKLLWFSDRFLVPFPSDSVLILSDLRYGGMRDTINGPEDLIFNFKVKEVNRQLVFSDTREPPRDMGEEFRKFIKRIKGY